MASQVKTLTSEALESAYRALTPSQSGFTEDLMASNTIIPVLDLTAQAEGEFLPSYLQTAWDFSTGLVTRTGAGSTTAANTAGFYKVDLTSTYNNGGSAAPKVTISDGLSSKTVWIGSTLSAGSGQVTTDDAEFYVYLRSGDSLVVTGVASTQTNVWTRQVADINGVLTDPLGFTPQ